MMDTIPPEITEVNFFDGKKLNNQSNLKIKLMISKQVLLPTKLL